MTDETERWHPIRSLDDLPTEDNQYLFQRRAGGIEVNFYVPNHSYAESYFIAYIAWMPMPPSYVDSTVRDRYEVETP